MPADQSTLSPVEAFNNPTAEKRARADDPRFDRAMNAFWRAFHCEGRDLQRCVAAAIRAADGEPAAVPRADSQEADVPVATPSEWEMVQAEVRRRIEGGMDGVMLDIRLDEINLEAEARRWADHIGRDEQ